MSDKKFHLLPYDSDADLITLPYPRRYFTLTPEEAESLRKDLEVALEERSRYLAEMGYADALVEDGYPATPIDKDIEDFVSAEKSAESVAEMEEAYWASEAEKLPEGWEDA